MRRRVVKPAVSSARNERQDLSRYHNGEKSGRAERSSNRVQGSALQESFQDRGVLVEVGFDAPDAVEGAGLVGAVGGQAELVDGGEVQLQSHVGEGHQVSEAEVGFDEVLEVHDHAGDAGDACFLEPFGDGGQHGALALGADVVGIDLSALRAKVASITISRLA